MKRFPAFAFLFLALTVLACVRENRFVGKPVRDFHTLARLFADPPNRYRTVPFWVWNADMSESLIDSQLAGFAENRIGGVFVHPRPGLITEYLSERWHSLFRYAVRKAGSYGIQVWIYDENSYPSGFGGGHTARRMPESVLEGHGLELTRCFRLPDTLKQPPFLLLVRNGDRFDDVTGSFETLRDRSGQYWLFRKSFDRASQWTGGKPYIDLLLEGVTDTFITATMEGYDRNIRRKYGSGIPGIFTDEPHVAPPAGVKWTTSLFEDFQKRWGYDLKAHLPSLWEPVGDWKKVRHNYFSLILDLFIERWSLPWRKACDERGLLWTGHYWEHSWPDPWAGPDPMAMSAWHHVPGIDILMNQYSEDVHGQFGNVRAVREIASLADQLGPGPALSETYGAAGWELRFQDMKRIADWQFVLGVTLVNQHLSYATIAGVRKHDHPPSFSACEPWWPLYGRMVDYLARMSLAVSSGERKNSILVLEPTSTAWMHWSVDKPDSAFEKLGPGFQSFLMDLEKRGVEYDLGSESVIKNHGSAVKGGLRIGKRTYTRIVLPPGLENLDAGTVSLIQTALAEGGTVLSFAAGPWTVDGSSSPIPGRLSEEFPDRWIRSKGLDDPGTGTVLASEGFSIQTADSGQGLLFHQRRALRDGQVLLLVNTHENQAASGSFLIPGRSVFRLNPEDERISTYPSKTEGKTLAASFDLPPCGSLLLFISKTGKPDTRDKVHSSEMSSIPFSSSIEVRRTSPNALVLDYVDLRFDKEEPEKDVYTFQAADRIFRRFGFDGNPWNRRIQYKTEILDMEPILDRMGFEVSFPFEISAGTDLSSIYAAVERPELWNIRINGIPVPSASGTILGEPDFRTFTLGSGLKVGSNVLTLRAIRMTVHTELEPVILLGDFNVEARDRGWILTPEQPLGLGSWQAQGLPFYSGALSYESSFRIEGQPKNVIVKLGSWSGTVAEVRVNGIQAGIIGGPPYELDVTGCSKKGENRIEVLVFGSLKNLLGPFHHKPPRGSTWPGHFESAPVHLPPGSEYDFIDYGLFEPFQILGLE